MIRSMTGYGRADAEGHGFRVSVEVSSVNNRYLKVFQRLPDGLLFKQGDLDRVVRANMARGAVNLGVRIAAENRESSYRVDAAVARAYLEQLAALPGGDALSVANVLGLPGVVDDSGPETNLPDELAGMVQDAVSRACQDMVHAREREGEALARDMLERAGEAGRILESIKELAPRLIPMFRQRLNTRLEALLKDIGVRVREEDVAREVAILAERADVSEEIVRLRVHLDAFHEIINGEQRGEGRRLDFLAQELLREANTIGSKSPDARLSALVVDLKTEIEKIKEQVQNVE